LLESPGDAKAIKSFVTKLQTEVALLVRTQPDLAETKLNAGKAVLEKAKTAAATEAAKRQVTSLSGPLLASLERSIETARMSLADLGQRVTENPNNLQSLSEFFSKAMSEVSALLRTQPEEAAKRIEVAKDVLQKVESAATSQNVKTTMTNYKRTIDSMARSAEAGKKIAEMIGKDAAPLKVEAWVNGSPLTDADLKGKVVFLDFWAVWCGPCIATFPHLREWNEKYGGKGLVMIGVTSYYNFEWDAEAKKAGRAQEKVTPAQEQEMLVHFAESHDLKHRFAIESDRSLSQYYGVTGIPHVVVIDQEGKIRLMKVGSGDANAKEIGDLLDKLLGPKAADGS
jgi:thiol-disulfide isomerase/thioredoxin